MAGDFAIYGAYGYTGSLIAEAASDRGLDPLLAGRNRRKLDDLATDLDCRAEAASLDDAAGLDALLEDVDAVLHCAGPFVDTYEPMLEACLRTETHYLDITGEIGVFAGIQRASDRAVDAGVTCLPGVGFDVVPTDCLAAHLFERAPEADELSLAFAGEGGLSPGTAKSAIEHVDEGGAVRRNGDIQRVPVAHEEGEVDFGWDLGERHVATIPWGDVFTAYHTTGIPNVTVSMAMHPRTVKRQRRLAKLGPVLGLDPINRFLQRLIERQVPGPDAEARSNTHSYVWGEATTADGDAVVSRLRCPNTYATTVDTALACTERVLAGEADVGFQTPAGAFGPDLILEATDAEREDVP